MEYVGGFQFDNIQFVGKISVCRAGKASTGIFAAGDDKSDWTDQKCCWWTMLIIRSLMQDIIAKLTAKDDKYACAIADKIISESQDTDKWYEFFDAFASLLNHPKSLVRNRVLYILSANAQWDDERELVHTPDSEYAILKEIICKEQWGM